MDNSKRIIASFFLIEFFFTQAKGSCILQLTTVICTGDEISDFKVTQKSATRLMVVNTKLEVLQAKALTGKYKELLILENKQLTRIDPLAFASSSSSATKLNIEECPQLGGSIWESVSKMSAMVYLELTNVSLTKVPDEAFRAMPYSLQVLTLSSNAITTFDASLVGLKFETLDLRNNNLSHNSFSDHVFIGVRSIKVLILVNNPTMTQLKKSQFKGLLDAETKVYVERGGAVGGEYMQCVGAEWLCAKDDRGAFLYEGKLQGYDCTETGFYNIFSYCKFLQERTDA